MARYDAFGPLSRPLKQPIFSLCFLSLLSCHLTPIGGIILLSLSHTRTQLHAQGSPLRTQSNKRQKHALYTLSLTFSVFGIDARTFPFHLLGLKDQTATAQPNKQIRLRSNVRRSPRRSRPRGHSPTSLVHRHAHLARLDHRRQGRRPDHGHVGCRPDGNMDGHGDSVDDGAQLTCESPPLLASSTRRTVWD